MPSGVIDRPRGMVAVLVAAVTLAGCGATGTGSARPSASGAGPRLTAVPSTSPRDIDAARYICTPDHPSFTIDGLLMAPPADAVDDPALAVLRDVLAAGSLPTEGWRRAAVTGDEVVFVAEWPGGEAPYAVVNVVPGGAGTALHDGWGADSYGGCTPRPVAPAGVTVANWYVDPSADALGPKADALSVLVHEQACASGQPAEGRILHPIVDYGETEVTITILVRTAPGAQECPGNPATPLMVELEEPVGDRVLRDGGQYPPGDPHDIPEGEFSLPR